MKAKSPAYPYLAWMIIFIVAPLLIVAYFAFTDKTGAFTLANISQAGQFSPVLLKSVYLAAIATVICLIIAYPLAYILSRTKVRTQRMLVMLVMLPMWMNFLLRTYAWMTILENNGILNRFFGLFGHEADCVIPWSDITTIGEDAVLVDYAAPKRTQKRGFLANFFENG